MTETLKPIDHTYFHVNNGGLSFNIDEVTETFKNLPTSASRPEYRITMETTTFGLGQRSSFPIYSTEMCDAIIAALMRTRMHMAEAGYREKNDFMSEPSTQYEGGYEIKARWSDEIQDGPNDTKKILLGHELWDGEQMVRFQPWEGKEIARWESGCDEQMADSLPLAVPLRQRIREAFRVLIGR